MGGIYSPVTIQKYIKGLEPKFVVTYSKSARVIPFKVLCLHLASNNLHGFRRSQSCHHC